MLLHERIKNKLNLETCLISTYYSRIVVCYYDEDGSCMKIEEPISDLANGTNNFAIDVSEMSVRVNRVGRNLLIHVRPQYSVQCEYGGFSKRYCCTLLESMQLADYLMQHEHEKVISIWKNGELMAGKDYWDNYIRLTEQGSIVLCNEILKKKEES